MPPKKSDFSPDPHALREFERACEAGDLDTAKQLVINGLNINLCDSVYTPVCNAADRNDVDAINMIIDLGADPNAPSGSGIKPLTIAVEKGHREAAAALLEKGANPNTGDGEFADPPILQASLSGDVELVRLLIKHNIKCRTKVEKLALSAAIKSGHNDIVRMLLDQKWPVRMGDAPRSKTSAYYLRLAEPLLVAAGVGNVDALHLLLEHGDDPNRGNYGSKSATPLVVAAMSGHLDVIKILIASGADPYSATSISEDPLMVLATRNKDLSLVKGLVDEKVYSFTQDEIDLTFELAINWCLPIFQFLLDSGYKPSKERLPEIKRRAEQCGGEESVIFYNEYVRNYA